jgi:hypothetical protein
MMSAMLVPTVKIVATGVLMSAMSVATTLGAADMNDTCDYYHYSDGPKCAHGYNDLSSRCYCSFL